MPTRSDLIRLAAAYPKGHPERRAILAGLSKRAGGNILLLSTGQYFDTRRFGVASQPLNGDAEDVAKQLLGLPARVEALVKDYLQGMRNQVGLNAEVTWYLHEPIEIKNGVIEGADLASVNMSKWPDNVGFGDWFRRLDAKHHIEREHD